MFNNSASDRIQMRAPGELMHPGACMLCGSGNKEWYVDLGVFYDYEGQMYLCNDCSQQVAEVIGCLIPDEAKHLQETSESLATQLSDAQKELEKANERLAVYDSVISSAFAGTAGLDASIAYDSSKAAIEAVEGAAEGESVSEESVKIGRRNDPERAQLRDAVPDGDQYRGGIIL